MDGWREGWMEWGEREVEWEEGRERKREREGGRRDGGRCMYILPFPTNRIITVEFSLTELFTILGNIKPLQSRRKEDLSLQTELLHPTHCRTLYHI